MMSLKALNAKKQFFNLTLNPSHGVEVRTAKANANAKAVRQTPNTTWQM
jgi:hypothetical protein